MRALPRVALLATALATAALLAPSASAHPVRTICGSYYGVNAYPGAYVNQLSTDPNSWTSSFVDVGLGPGTTCQPNSYPFPCIVLPTDPDQCGSSDGNHIPVGTDPCPDLDPPCEPLHPGHPISTGFATQVKCENPQLKIPTNCTITPY